MFYSSICLPCFRTQNKLSIGRIAEIITRDGTSAHFNGYVVLESFLIAEELHPDFQLPFVHRPGAALPRFVIVKSSV